jgi:hypothetical protein
MGGMEKSAQDELLDLYSLPSRVRKNKSRRMRFGEACRMNWGEKKHI